SCTVQTRYVPNAHGQARTRLFGDPQPHTPLNRRDAIRRCGCSAAEHALCCGREPCTQSAPRRRTVDEIEFIPTPEQYAWTFGGAESVMRVRPGTALRLWTEDAFGGRLRGPADQASAKLP